MKSFRSPVVIAAAAMAVLPFALLAGGLTLTSATDVVIFAIACMALNWSATQGSCRLVTAHGLAWARTPLR